MNEWWVQVGEAANFSAVLAFESGVIPGGK